jgi:uncharacterized membrane protein YphA (DoxX/SURF4 family)
MQKRSHDYVNDYTVREGRVAVVIPHYFQEVCRMNASILFAGRILFSIPFLVFGINHFRFAEGMAGMVPIPGGAFWVYFTGLAQVLAAIAFLSGKQMRLAALLTAVLMIIYALSIHLPGFLGAGDDMAAGMNAMSSMLKDLGLAGGALALAYASDLKK